MQAQKVGIKETLDVLVAAEASLDAVVKACADGQVSLTDLRHVVAPARAAAEAIKGKDLIPVELADVDEAELNVLIDRAVAVASKAMDVFDAVAKVLEAK